MNTPDDKRQRQIDALAGVLDEIEDYLEQRQDVRDGSDGPRPNTEMGLLSDLRWWRECGLVALASTPSAIEAHVDGKWCADLKCAKCYAADTWQRSKVTMLENSLTEALEEISNLRSDMERGMTNHNADLNAPRSHEADKNASPQFKPTSPDQKIVLGAKEELAPSGTVAALPPSERRSFPICKDHAGSDWNMPTLDDDDICVLCRLFYLEAQEGLLEVAQQRAEKAEDAIKDMERPMTEQMARLNETVTRLNYENERLRSASSAEIAKSPAFKLLEEYPTPICDKWRERASMSPLVTGVWLEIDRARQLEQMLGAMTDARDYEKAAHERTRAFYADSHARDSILEECAGQTRMRWLRDGSYVWCITDGELRAMKKTPAAPDPCSGALCRECKGSGVCMKRDPVYQDFNKAGQ